MTEIVCIEISVTTKNPYEIKRKKFIVDPVIKSVEFLSAYALVVEDNE